MRRFASPWPRRLGWALAALLGIAGCAKGPSNSEDKPKEGDTSGGANLAEQRKQSADNLKRIGMAIHDYHDANNSMRNAYLPDRAGKPGLSWRVALLPFLGEEELYKQFRLDEPWDSEHNVKLLDKMPKVYAPVVPTKEKNVTFYRVFVGNGTAFGPPGTKVTLSMITNLSGTANTFMVVEAGEAVPWTKPDELPFDPERPLPKLGGHQVRDGFCAVMCDGSVWLYRNDAPPKVLAQLINWRNQEPIHMDKVYYYESKGK